MGSMESSRYDDLTSAFVKDFILAQNKKGMDPNWFSLRIKSLCLAKKTDTFKGEIKTQEPVFDDLGLPVFDKDGKIVMVDKAEDVVIYSKPLEDNATRLKALTLAMIIRGVQTTSPTNVTNIHDAKEVNIMGAVAQIMAANGEDVDD